MPRQADLPDPPYYAVIFSSRRNDQDDSAYQAMATQMEILASQQQGYIGFESVRDVTGAGISISYWTDLESIRLWKQQLQHQQAQQRGKETWYQYYRVHVTRVERTYEFER
jgi:heme-degrading monooxygenase HmoA